MFHREWFIKHQKKLLWLLNTPLARLWFRWVLRINGNKSSVGENKIIGILPNAIFWKGKKKNQYVAEFRTHPKFAKRIHYAFRPFWLLLHAWDTLIANPFLPTWNLGFDTTGDLFPDASTGSTTVDGVCGHNYAAGSGVAWATLRADPGNLSDDTSADFILQEIVADSTTDNFRRIRRPIWTWDTNSIPSGSTIDDGTIKIKGTATNHDTAASITNDLNIVAATPAANNDLVDADYAQTGATAFSTAIASGSWSQTAYNTFTLNASGRSNITAAGISRFGGRNDTHDRANSAPSWVNGATSRFSGLYADQAGTTEDPILNVTYTPPAAGVPFDLTSKYW